MATDFKMKRVLFAGLFHETHTFVQGTTELSDFAVLRGAEVLACAGDSSPMGGALEAASRLGWQVVPAIDMRASPSARVSDAAFEWFWDRFETAASVCAAEPVDWSRCPFLASLICTRISPAKWRCIRIALWLTAKIRTRMRGNLRCARWAYWSGRCVRVAFCKPVGRIPP